MKYLLLPLLAITISASVQAQSAKHWNIDKSHASVDFTATHFFTDVDGEFHEFEGDIHFSPDNLKGSKATFNIKVSSIDTDEPDRDEHLRSPDFFNAAKHPEITFVSTRFEKKTDKEFIVHGKLSMSGVTKEVKLPLTITGRMDNPWKEGYEIMGVKIETTIDRTDYEVGTGDWAATTVVGDDVDVNINMELDAEK